jgi:hypothetical protein
MYSYIILLSQNIEGLLDCIKFKRADIQALRESKENILKTTGLQTAEK